MRLLRSALEGNDSRTNDSEKGVVIKGPLSDAFTDALHEEYAKTPEEDGPALESSANDTMMMQQLAKSLTPDNSAPTDSFQTVYGVSKDEVTSDTIVEVSNELAASSNTSDFILVIDGTTPGVNSDSSSAPIDRAELMVTSLECLVKSYGGKVYGSLRQYARTRR